MVHGCIKKNPLLMILQFSFLAPSVFVSLLYTECLKTCSRLSIYKEILTLLLSITEI